MTYMLASNIKEPWKIIDLGPQYSRRPHMFLVLISEVSEFLGEDYAEALVSESLSFEDEVYIANTLGHPLMVDLCTWHDDVDPEGNTYTSAREMEVDRWSVLVNRRYGEVLSGPLTDYVVVNVNDLLSDPETEEMAWAGDEDDQMRFRESFADAGCLDDVLRGFVARNGHQIWVQNYDKSPQNKDGKTC